MLGVALVPIGVVIAALKLPSAIAIGIVAIGVGLALIAFGIPQGASKWLSRVHGEYIQRVLESSRIEEARRLCTEAADVVHELLLPDFNAGNQWTHPAGRRVRQIISTYEQLHRAQVVHAVEAGIGADSRQATILELAKHPRDLTDLHALHAGLLRMVLELSQRLDEPSPEVVALGGHGA